MCLFPTGRLITPRFSRIAAAKRATERENIVEPTAKDIVRILGLTKDNQYEKAASFCNCLWRMPYEEQLRFKERRAIVQMQRLSKVIQKSIVLPITDDQTGLFRCLTVYPIVPSPKTIGYRGKDGFVVNIGIDGDKATVGTPYGASRLLVSIPPTDTLRIAKPIHRTVAYLFQHYLRSNETAADLVAPTYFDPGGYKSITVRSSRADKIMIIIQFHGHGFKRSRIEEEKQRLADYFLGRDFSQLPSTSKISSLYFCMANKAFARNEETTFEHVGGKEYIEEEVLGRKFRVSAESFFQTNVDCAEELFRTVIDQCRLDKDNTVLLDVGCGAGVYSIVLSNHVKQAVGIDVNSHCIKDAEINAEMNDVKNAKFITGRLETLPKDFLDHLANTNEQLVAIVNPGRWGVLADTIKALRQLKSLSTLIYVSCYPYETAFVNFVTLLKQPDGHYGGQPFRVTKAIPVDMFPQTPHYELILLFER